MKITYGDIVADITITQKARPAPYCNDHDSPAFSDPGCEMEFDINSAQEGDRELTDAEIAALYENDDFYTAVCEHEE